MTGASLRLGPGISKHRVLIKSLSWLFLSWATRNCSSDLSMAQIRQKLQYLKLYGRTVSFLWPTSHFSLQYQCFIKPVLSWELRNFFSADLWTDSPCQSATPCMTQNGNSFVCTLEVTRNSPRVYGFHHRTFFFPFVCLSVNELVNLRCSIICDWSLQQEPPKESPLYMLKVHFDCFAHRFIELSKKYLLLRFNSCLKLMLYGTRKYW